MRRQPSAVPSMPSEIEGAARVARRDGARVAVGRVLSARSASPPVGLRLAACGCSVRRAARSSICVGRRLDPRCTAGRPWPPLARWLHSAPRLCFLLRGRRPTAAAIHGTGEQAPRAVRDRDKVLRREVRG